MTSDLKALLERVEASSGADDLADIRKQFLIAVDPDYAGANEENVGGARRPFDSLDDAISLLERRLPGWKWALDSYNGAFLESADEHSYDGYIGDGLSGPGAVGGATPALALLAALLRALIEQEKL